MRKKDLSVLKFEKFNLNNKESLIYSDFNCMMSKEEQKKIDRLKTKQKSFIEDKVQKAVDMSMSDNSEMLHSSVRILRILVKVYSNDILEPQRGYCLRSCR